MATLITGTFILVGVNFADDAPEIKQSEKERAPVVMEALKVDGNYIPKLSFGLSLEVWKNNDTQKIVALYVGGVRVDSPAYKKGIGPRARIYRINGRPVEEITASFFKGTELNDLFVHRLEGARVTLEIGFPGEMEPRTIVLEEIRGVTIPGVMDVHRT